MTRPEVLKAMVAVSCYLILSLSILRNHAARLLLSQSRGQQRVAKRKRDYDNDDDDMGAICMIVHELAAGIGYNFRRFWVDERSHHWITHVLNRNMLRDERFEKTFRMSRKSFELLHGLLGTCYYPVLSTHI